MHSNAISYKILMNIKTLIFCCVFYSQIASAANPGCVPAPNFSVMNEGKVDINITSSNDQWVSTGVNVSANKSLKMAWGTANLYKYPEKYRVLYRIDPRFNRPQLLIKKYDYNSQIWSSDFNEYVGRYGPHSLMMYQSSLYYQINDRMAVLQDLSDYMSFAPARSPITVKAGDFVNISLITSTDFFTTPGAYPTGDIVSYTNPAATLLFTSSGLAVENSIVYISIGALCDYLNAHPSVYSGNYTCNYLYFKSDHSGSMTSGGYGFGDGTGMPVCSVGADNIQNSACYYDNGRGMTISIAGQVIKPTYQGFTSNIPTQQSIFSTIAASDGPLDFNTSWNIGNMYYNIPKQFMYDWTSANNTVLMSAEFNYIHSGRYFLEVEVGNAFGFVGDNAVDVEYIVSNSTPTGVGTLVAANNEIFPTTSGTLWIKVKNNGSSYTTGNVTVYYANYTGDTGFSSFVSNTIVEPICNGVRNMMITLYSNLSSSGVFKSIAISLLTLYIITYALFFLAGSVAVKLHDLIYRVIKISIVVAMFSNDSWTIFNDSLFQLFTEGTKYLIFNIIGTNGTDNMFGFVDFIFQKYLNGNLWLNLLVELVDFSSGLTFAAILVIIGMFKYLFAVCEVIISYIISFILVSVLISLAPVFILFSLFSKTFHLFRNWLSAIFNAALYPTLLLLFFLMIDDILVSQLENAVLGSCWDDKWIPLKFNIGIAIPGFIKAFTSFTLPFLPGIPFYAPNVGNGSIISGDPSSYLGVMGASIIFYCFANMASNLSGYITSITGALTSIGAVGGGIAGQQGVHSAIKDMKDAPYAVVRKPLNAIGDTYHKIESTRTSFKNFVNFADKVYNRSKEAPNEGESNMEHNQNASNEFEDRPENLSNENMRITTPKPPTPSTPPTTPASSPSIPSAISNNEGMKNFADILAKQVAENIKDSDSSNDLHDFEKEINKAYKKMALKYHPDKNGGTEEAKENFQNLANAKDILNSAKGSEYRDYIIKEAFKK